MRYFAIVLSPLLLFSAVVLLGFWLSDDAEPWQPLTIEAPPPLAVNVVFTPPRGLEPVRTSPAIALPVQDSRIPAGLEAPLRAVASDINLCVPHSLERDLGPIDVQVRFTPIRGGAFGREVSVASSWDNEEVERCVAEVFEETTFMPEPNGRFEPSEFTFHFPDDAERGFLGMRFVR